MNHVTLPGGEVVPSMGQGTWKMGERAERRSDEIAALRERKNQVHYSAAKAGVIAMSRCLAEAWAEHNIRVNTISPENGVSCASNRDNAQLLE